MFVCMWVIICNEYNKFLITSSISFVDSGVLLLMVSSSHGWTSGDLLLMGGWVVCLLMGMGGLFIDGYGWDVY